MFAQASSLPLCLLEHWEMPVVVVVVWLLKKLQRPICICDPTPSRVAGVWWILNTSNVHKCLASPIFPKSHTTWHFVLCVLVGLLRHLKLLLAASDHSKSRLQLFGAWIEHFGRLQVINFIMGSSLAILRTTQRHGGVSVIVGSRSEPRIHGL